MFIRCQKLNISLVFATQPYFSVPKDVRLNSTHYLIVKINHKRELENIGINHSVDIDYKDYMKIYREYTKKPFKFLLIDTTSVLMLPDQIKILNRKIMQNEAHYDLDIKAAKISQFSSNNLDKYEYLTGEDWFLNQVLLNK